MDYRLIAMACLLLYAKERGVSAHLKRAVSLQKKLIEELKKPKGKKKWTCRS